MTKAVKPQPGQSGYVGRGHPPQQHQFKKGTSGNPAGRPPGRQSELARFYEELVKPIPLPNGTTTTFAVLLANSVRKQVNTAKDMKPVEFSLRLLERLEPAAEDESELIADNKRNLIDAGLARLAARRADGQTHLSLEESGEGEGEDDDDEGSNG
jgi:hypothetical protein